MKYKNKIKLLLLVIIISVIILLIKLTNNDKVKMEIELNTENKITGQLFYTYNEYEFSQYFQDISKLESKFNEKQSLKQKLTNGVLKFVIPTNNVKSIRIDLGSNPGKIVINKISIHDKLKTITLIGNEISSIFDQYKNIELIQETEASIELFSKNKDPYIYMNPKITYNKLLNDKGNFNIWLIIESLTIATFITIGFYYLLKGKNIEKNEGAKIIFIGVILFIVCMPYIASKLGISIINNSERRNLKDKPLYTANVTQLDQYIKSYEEYFNDSFGLRDELIRVNNYINKKFFNISELEKVTVGKDGWLFYSGEGRFAELQQRGIKMYSEDDLQKILKNLQEKQNYLKKKGCKFILFIPPDKETIYGEYLPKNIKKVTNKTKLDQVIQYVRNNSDIKIVDVRDMFKLEKNVNLIYYKTDTHWNKYGAYLAYGELMKAINTCVTTTQAYKQENFIINRYKFDTGGDLANMLNLKKEYKEEYIEFILIDGNQAEKPNYDKSGEVIISTNKNKKLPKLVMFRDSFTSNLAPFLSEHFGISVYKWNDKVDSKLIEKYNPDIVILEIIERNIDKLLLDNPSEIK